MKRKWRGMLLLAAPLGMAAACQSTAPPGPSPAMAAMSGWCTDSVSGTPVPCRMLMMRSTDSVSGTTGRLAMVVVRDQHGALVPLSALIPVCYDAAGQVVPCIITLQLMRDSVTGTPGRPAPGARP